MKGPNAWSAGGTISVGPPIHAVTAEVWVGKHHAPVDGTNSSWGGEVVRPGSNWLETMNEASGASGTRPQSEFTIASFSSSRMFFSSRPRETRWTNADTRSRISASVDPMNSLGSRPAPLIEASIF